jgi:hypothetical protein
MKSYALALVVGAAMGFAGAAYAGSATAPKAMTDSEMDKVTAGAINLPGFGKVTAGDARGFPVAVPSPGTPRTGVCTTGASGRCTGGF